MLPQFTLPLGAASAWISLSILFEHERESERTFMPFYFVSRSCFITEFGWPWKIKKSDQTRSILLEENKRARARSGQSYDHITAQLHRPFGKPGVSGTVLEDLGGLLFHQCPSYLQMSCSPAKKKKERNPSTAELQ